MIPYRRPARQAIARRRSGTKRTVHIAAPVGGWNTRDALDLMPATDAVELKNWFPGQGKVEVRGGSANHASGVGSGNVEMIAEFNAGATRKMLSAGGGSIYDSTSGGTATSLASGFSENRWEVANFNGNMGLVNGTDAPQTFDGSTVSSMTVSGSGLTVSNLKGIFVHQSRTYFWENDSQDFWYSAVNALGGSLTKFPLSRVGQFGGNLVCAGSWSPDGSATDFGGSTTDVAVFVMSSGDVILYQGDDPGSNWALIGVYRIGAPLDVRGIVKIGGDLVILTRQGLVSVTQMIRQGHVRQGDMLSDKIRPTFIDAGQTFETNTGWQCLYYQKQNMLLVNIPVTSTEFHQYVMNTQTGAWCRFEDLNARCWGIFDSKIYFGDTSGNVVQADTGFADKGTNISADCRTAYSYFDRRDVLKKVSALRPVFVGQENVSIGVAPQFDYQITAPTVTSITFGPSQNTWENIDVNWEDWDENWGEGANVAFAQWFAAGGVGYAVGSRVQASTSVRLEWQTMAYNMEIGGGLF